MTVRTLFPELLREEHRVGGFWEGSFQDLAVLLLAPLSMLKLGKQQWRRQCLLMAGVPLPS